MTNELWTPTETERICNGKSYVKYALGVVLLNDPLRFLSIFGMDNLCENNKSKAFSHAKSLAKAGLTEVIQYSNEPIYRSPLSAMEDKFEDALPHMLESVNDGFEYFGEQLDALNPALRLVRPMPLSNEVVYKNICHSRVTKLDAASMMGGFMIAEIFESIGD